MQLYTYDGPVLVFKQIVANHWKASTHAVSEEKARCNLAYQFATQTGRVPRTKISLPGEIKCMNNGGIKNA